MSWNRPRPHSRRPAQRSRARPGPGAPRADGRGGTRRARAVRHPRVQPTRSRPATMPRPSPPRAAPKRSAPRWQAARLPCVALDDPARVWAVINKTRPERSAGLPAVRARDARRACAASKAVHCDRMPQPPCPRWSGAAGAAGVGEIALLSGFRSYETQQTTYSNQVGAQGVEQADLASARPGFSEHQSGLCGRRRRVRRGVRHAR